MLPYRWTSIKPERRDKDTKEKGIRVIKAIKDVSLHLEKEEDHKSTNPPTDAPDQEEHASNVGKWATSLETAQRRGNKRALTSSTITTRNRSASHLPLCQGTTWL